MDTFKSIIMKERGGGKTTDAIKLSSETGYIIVKSTVTGAVEVERLANRLGIPIPKPISLDRLQEHCVGRKATYIIDDIVQCFCHLLGVGYDRIAGATITCGETYRE